MAITIRLMTIDDLAAVYHLGCACYPMAEKPYNYWTVAEVADHLQRYAHLCYVADADRQIVGFVLGADQYEPLPQAGHLEWVAVAASHRRQGVAGRLMETLINVYRRQGRTQVVTDIADGNTASQAMARALGFTPAFAITFFHKDLTKWE